jgi:hypothetical protein
MVRYTYRPLYLRVHGMDVLEKRTISLLCGESNHDFSKRAAGVYYTDYPVQIPG